MADDLVTGHHWIHGAAPLVANLMDVAVADATVVDCNDDVVWAGLAAIEVKGSERRGLGLRGVAKRFHV